MGDKRNGREVVIGTPKVKTLFGRSRYRQQLNNETGLKQTGWNGGDWTQLACERNKWRAVMKMARNFRVLQRNSFYKVNYYELFNTDSLRSFTDLKSAVLHTLCYTSISLLSSEIMTTANITRHPSNVALYSRGVHLLYTQRNWLSGAVHLRKQCRN